MTIQQKMKNLGDTYDQIEKSVSALKAETCLSCVKGCGECCKRFEPYISVLEAIPLAKYLQENPEKHDIYKKNVVRNEEEWTSCPFYDDENPSHCTIYSIRPLICRLFGFSANKKKGETTLATCQKIEKNMPLEVEKAKRYVQLTLDVPIYQEIAEKIQSIDFELATDYHPFSRSVDIAMNNYSDIMTGKFTSAKSEGKAEHNFSNLLRQKIKAEV